jgi:hypothetical protein
MHFVKSAVIVILHPKADGTHEFIAFNEFNITDGMYLLSPANDFVGSVVVNEFEQMG